MKFDKKVIVVTGAGNGMGREIVFRLLEQGANVAAVDINPNTLKETIELSGVDNNRISSHVLDVRDLEGVIALPEQVLSHHGKVNGIINNAGVASDMIHFTQLDKKNQDFIMDINLHSVLNLTRAFLPHILKSNERGLVANTSSMASFIAVPGQSMYCASKAAVKLFTEVLYMDLRNENVTVSCIMPGAIDTQIAANSGGKAQKIDGISPDKASRIILKGLMKEKLRIFVGPDAKMMDKLHRLMPVKTLGLIERMMRKMLKDSDYFQ